MERQYVGIDLRRRRSAIVRMTKDGEVPETVRIDNDPVALALEVAKTGDDPEVVLEATYRWYWAADVLEANGANVHLAHPLGMKGFENRRVKNDVRGAVDLAHVLRINRLPEAWIAPADSASYGSWSATGPSSLRYGPGSRLSCTDRQGRHPGSDVDGHARRDDRHRARGPGRLPGQQAICGVGPVIAAVFVAEIDDLTRFPSPRHLASWSGLTPRHHKSDTTVWRGHITKQGSRLVRWAALDAVARQRGGTHLLHLYHELMDRRNSKGIAKVAVARKLLHLVYYGLRDGESRCVDRAA